MAAVGEAVGVAVGVALGVVVAVAVGETVGDDVAVAVNVGVADDVGDDVIVGDGIGVAVGVGVADGVGVTVGVGAAPITSCPFMTVKGSEVSPPTAAKFVTATVSGDVAPNVAVPVTTQAMSASGSPGAVGAFTPSGSSEKTLNLTASGAPSPLLSRLRLQRPPSNTVRLIRHATGATRRGS